MPVTLRLVVINPELGLFSRHDIGHALHRSAALIFVVIDVRNAAVVPVLFEVDGIAREQHRAGLRQLNQQRLMARSVPGVAMMVTLPSPNTSWSPSSLVTGNSGLKRGPAGRRPFVLGFLHKQHRLREHRNIADMIGMAVGDRDVFDIRGFHTELLKLGRERLRSPPVSRARIGGALAFGHGGDGIGHSGIPQQPTLLCLIR